MYLKKWEPYSTKSSRPLLLKKTPHHEQELVKIHEFIFKKANNQTKKSNKKSPPVKAKGKSQTLRPTYTVKDQY